MKLFDLALQLNGFPLKSAETYLREIQNNYGTAVEEYQKKKRGEILDFHLSNTPFYKKLAGDYRNNWSELPILTKRHLQHPLKDRLSTPYRNKNLYINKTSGSTGDPFIFAKDKFCHALTWAVIKNRFAWHGIDLNNSLQARFYGMPRELKGSITEKAKDLFSNRKRFSVFDLSDKAFEKALNSFKSNHFEYLNGYTTAIVQFAKFLEVKNIILKDICPTLRVCVVTSEILFEKDKELMEKWFGIKVVNEYGASELDLIAFEDNEGSWRINWESLFVEIVDESGNAVTDGNEGRILITSLYNKAHPFIRYEIGDIGSLKNTSGGYPVLEKLVGRSNDLVTLPSGKTAAGLTLYYVTKSLIEDQANVKEFVIEQHSRRDFKIIYVSDNELNPTQFERINAAMTRYLEPGLNYVFERKPFIERTKSGKLKQFKNLTLPA